MEFTIEEIADVLRSTDTMAAEFAERVEERLGRSVSHTEILDVMKTIPAKSLSMTKVVSKLRRQREKKKR